MNPMAAYSRRFERKRRLLQAGRRAFDLKRRKLRLNKIKPDDLLLFCTQRNEAPRLPYFFDYYRDRGVKHFLIVDNGSDDGAAEWLEAQPDVSLWTTNASYRRANYGVHWLNALLHRYGNKHWCLVLDPDEFLVYPHCDTRDIPMLCDYLESGGRRSFGTLLLDMYGKSPISETHCEIGADPVAAAPWFDPANYFYRRNDRYRNLWIQGGPRMRAFFPDRPMFAPALNKIPLVKWRRGDALVSSTHCLLPRALNITYDDEGGERVTGALLHAKFLSMAREKVTEEIGRAEHFAGGREYRAYAQRIGDGLSLWTPHSVKYENWRQLAALGLIARGGWL